MMNMMSLLLVAVVAFTYFGGQNVPKVLKDNKQMVLGVFVGVLLHQFMGIGVEGGNFGEGTGGYPKIGDEMMKHLKGEYDQGQCIDCIQYATSPDITSKRPDLDLSICRSSTESEIGDQILPCDGMGPETRYESILSVERMDG